MKMVILAISILASCSSFAGTSAYLDSVKKINAALLDKNVVAVLQREAVEKVEIGGDDDLDVKITSKNCQMVVGLTPIVSRRSVVGYKAQNLPNCD